MPQDTTDPFDLRRFVDAQEHAWPAALAEIRAGMKRTHWMWFVFPQFAGLGSSPAARHYAIRSRAEAAAYLRHPVLGPRLIEGCEAVLGVQDRPVIRIFGSIDAMKLRSCATLFDLVAPGESVFRRVLEKCYDGQADESTSDLLREADRIAGD